MKKASIGIAACIAWSQLGVAAAQELRCEDYANYPGEEPPGYAEQCLAKGASSPLSPPDRFPSDTAHKYQLRTLDPNQGLSSYQVGNFAAETFIADPFPATSTFALDYDAPGTTLWAIRTSPSTLGTINPTTGVFTPGPTVTPPTGHTLTGLTIDPITNTFYVATVGGGGSHLHTLNPTTGALTLVGQMGSVAVVIDLAMNCQGELYAHDIVTDSLYRINPTTAAPTLVGPHGLAANFAQGMDFDNSDGTLYGCIYTGGGTNTYCTWNTSTGAITPLNVNSPLGEFECAIPPPCPANLSVTKTASATNPMPGQPVSFTITVTNAGPGNAYNVVATDALPAGLTFVSTSGCAEDPAGVPTCTLGTIPVGMSVSYTINTLVAPTASGALVNNVTVSGRNFDPQTGNNSGSATVVVQIPPQMIPTLGTYGLLGLAGLLTVLALWKLRGRLGS